MFLIIAYIVVVALSLVTGGWPAFFGAIVGMLLGHLTGGVMKSHIKKSYLKWR